MGKLIEDDDKKHSELFGLALALGWNELIEAERQRPDGGEIAYLYGLCLCRNIASDMSGCPNLWAFPNLIKMSPLVEWIKALEKGIDLSSIGRNLNETKH